MTRARLGFCALLLGAGLIGGGVAYAASSKDETAHNDQSSDEIARGRYLTTLGDCAACHTDPGGKPYAGGEAIDTPFGVVATANITPDVETGIGSWSDDDFVSALQTGRGKDGIRLYPAMPYPYFAKMSRDDILAIRAYLDTLEPVHQRVRTDQLPFPFKFRFGMLFWNALFFDRTPFEPVAGKSTEWNRGAYIVEGPGHCGACHTPKNFLGGDKTSDALHGATLQGWFASDLTGDKRSGLGDWSSDDIVAYLKSGRNPHAAATGTMAQVIADSTSQMRDGDLKAIATYLKDVPAPQQAAAPAVASTDPAMRAGQAIYIDNCSACHARDGSGVAKLIPPLKDSPNVQSPDATSLGRVVLHGTQSVATAAAPTGPSMPAFGWKLTDQQAASVLTYIRNSWGNAASAVNADQIADLRSPSR
ncbi:MAG TPA: cytochrome c [Stellaceae bacterium]|nr:cytochrome c [Stellaceae bacterium]